MPMSQFTPKKVFDDWIQSNFLVLLPNATGWLIFKLILRSSKKFANEVLSISHKTSLFLWNGFSRAIDAKYWVMYFRITSDIDCLRKEFFLKWKVQYGWPPSTNLLRSAHFYVNNIISLFYKTSHLHEEVKCTEPSLSVRILWFTYWINLRNCAPKLSG